MTEHVFEQVARVCYCAAPLTDAEKAATATLQGAFSAAVPAKQLTACELLEIMWQCKVTGKGLTPVRPVVVARKTVNLPNGSFLKL